MFIREIRLQNLLSFGPDTPPLELRPLNVLIGPNGSGKSNLIEAIGLLQAAPRDISEPIRRGGGPLEWIWKGLVYPEVAEDRSQVYLEANTSLPGVTGNIKHRIRFEKRFSGAFFIAEDIDLTNSKDGSRQIYHSYHRHAIVYENGDVKSVELSDEDASQSVLSLRQSAVRSFVVDSLSDLYKRIRIYRDIDTANGSVLRSPQRGDERNDFLSESLENFGVVLSRLKIDSNTKARILEQLSYLNPVIKDIDVLVEGGTVQVFLQEDQYSIPALRLSDGTLRFLCLVLVLCHPNPPPLICIEEPELGLHPDMMPTIAELLREASTRTQLVVTTHSSTLVDALSETPEDVIVCEKHHGATEMTRLSKDVLGKWLKDYGLGYLWRTGEIGGNRW